MIEGFIYIILGIILGLILEDNLSLGQRISKIFKGEKIRKSLYCLFAFHIFQVFFIFGIGRECFSSYGELYSIFLILCTIIACAWWISLFKDFKKMNRSEKFFILYIGVGFIASYMTANNLDFLLNRNKYFFNICIVALPVFLGYILSSNTEENNKNSPPTKEKK